MLSVLKDYQVIFGILIAIVGWFCTYYFNNRVQDRRLRNDILNTARKEITQDIRNYQEWLTNLYVQLSSIRDSTDWQKTRQDCYALFFQKNDAWERSTEDYLILFQEMRVAREKLSTRHWEIKGMLISRYAHINYAYQSKDDSLRRELGESLEPLSKFISDQCNLMQDMMIYLQNRCLGEITGNKATKRQPQDPYRPQIITNSQCLLDINNNDVDFAQKELQKGIRFVSPKSN